MEDGHCRAPIKVKPRLQPQCHRHLSVQKAVWYYPSSVWSNLHWPARPNQSSVQLERNQCTVELSMVALYQAGSD